MAVSRTTIRILGQSGGKYDGQPIRPKPRNRAQSTKIGGLPKLESYDLFSAAPDGTTVAIARNQKLSTFRIVRSGDRVRAEPSGSVKLPGRALAIMHAPDGGLHARVEVKKETHIVAIAGEVTHTILCVEGRVVDTVLTRSNVVSAIAGDTFGTHRLIISRRRDGRTVREVPLSSPRVRLRAGSGDEILIVDRGTRVLRMVDTSSRVDDCAPPRHHGKADVPTGTPPSTKPCRTCCGSPCTCRDPGDGLGDGGQPDGGRPPNRDPDGQCIPGDDGDPDGCLVTYAFGAMLVTVNICEPGSDPCTFTLDRPVGSLRATRRAVVALSADGRRAMVLERETLRSLYEHRVARAAVVATVARDADLIFLRDSDGTVSLLDPTPILPALLSGTALHSDIASSAVYLGASAGVSNASSAIQRGTRRVMVVPALEPGQGFSPSGTTANFANDVGVVEIIDKVLAFYQETTRHSPPEIDGLEIEFIWFGRDTPELYTGQPITLPQPFKNYWGPAWDPGHVKATVSIPASGATIEFSGDETLTLDAIPAPAETYDPKTFELRFPAASYAGRIPNALPTITLGSGPVRSVAVAGDDRQGNFFSINVDTNALSSPVPIDLTRTALEADASQLDALADALQTMLDSAAGFSGMFDRPRVLWHDDGDETGILHVSLSFAAGPGSTTPRVTTFSLDSLLAELGAGSIAASFTMPGAESAMATYLWRIVADASASHEDFGADLSVSYFELVKKWKPSVVTDAGQMTTRISLSTEHGRDPARIDVSSQSGLASIGMDNPDEVTGADTTYSGGGGPKFNDSTLFDDAYTAMVDMTIQEHGAEQFAINVFNQYFNCFGIDSPIECSLQTIDAFVVTPVYPSFNGTGKEPDLVNGERANSNRHETIDTKADERAVAVMPFGANRATIVAFIAPDSLASPARGDGSAATLAHELGHGVVGLPDLYGSSGKRLQAEYIGGHCIMGNSSSFSHFCAYNQRIKGWLEDDAIALFDRPTGDDPLDQELVLIQLEHWDPLLDEDQRTALAQSALPGMSDDTPVVAAAFLRLGGDGRQFDIVELRGVGVSYSQTITPSRVLITNAIDPEDDTRYATDEIEGAGTTRGVLERYRVKVHLMSADLRAVGDVYDFASSAEFPEVGLTVEVLEWGTASSGSASFDVVRIRIEWERGAAIDLGFIDSTPDWQSPDIAVIRPEMMDDEGNFDFPEGQNTPDEEVFRVPSDPDEELLHKVAVRVWNFGDAEAKNVQVGFIRKRPGGSGDWKSEFDTSEVLPDPLDAEPQIIAFDWPVNSTYDTHVCFRAQIGDRDVPRDDNGLALASDDTNASNDWAQQNAFIFDAEASSPPDPVDFTHQVDNRGSFLEEVHLRPRGLAPGSKVTVTPTRLHIAPFSRGLFRVRVELEERLLTARCGKDITFVLEAWRKNDDSEERWGGAKYTIRPRLRTTTQLSASILPNKLHLIGSVSPDVGAQDVLLHVQRPGLPSIWDTVPLGPGSTFDYEILDEFPPDTTVRAVAYYDGSIEYAKSVSAPVTVDWTTPG